MSTPVETYGSLHQLRDHFAGLAMQAIVNVAQRTSPALARDAYIMADNMLVERAKAGDEIIRRLLDVQSDKLNPLT
jgi:hypothetical protein